MSWSSMGQAQIGRIVESNGPFMSIYKFFPDATPELLAPHRNWLEPNALEPNTDMLIFPIQSYVVRTPNSTVLVDSCVGNHKSVSWFPEWDKRTDNSYLEGFKSLGIHPDEIDYVLCTHLHVDHSGWNTRLVHGRWEPTFKNARYVLSEKECDAALKSYEKFKDPVYVEYVLPLLEADQVDLVRDDHNLNDYVWLEPTPGHTPGHCAVRVRSGDENAVISGDLIHSPIQCPYPEWNFEFDYKPELASETRRKFLETYSDCATRVYTAHFPLPSGGHIHSTQKAFHFVYDDFGE